MAGMFEFIRNDKLDARNYFALTRQILKRNQFGADLGGPLSIPHLYSGKDRTFFFFNYEGQRLRQGLIFNSIVPNAAQRGGNFGSKTIYDPLLTCTVTAINNCGTNDRSRNYRAYAIPEQYDPFSSDLGASHRNPGV